MIIGFLGQYIHALTFVKTETYPTIWGMVLDGNIKLGTSLEYGICVEVWG